MLNHQQRKEDKMDAITARRAAAENLRVASVQVDAAIRKLAYNKSNPELFELKKMASEIQENIEMLEDPENDPG